MAKTPKRPRDPNQLAKLITDIATGENSETRLPVITVQGSAGGKVGGPARVKALTPGRRKEIATKAAKSRWKTSAHND